MAQTPEESTKVLDETVTINETLETVICELQSNLSTSSKKSIQRQLSFNKTLQISTRDVKRRRRSNSIAHSSTKLCEEDSLLSALATKNARLIAEAAIQKNKVFAIFGPYASIRRALRKRGWVEKFYNPKAVNFGQPVAPIKMPNGAFADEMFFLKSSSSSNNNPRRRNSYTDDDDDDNSSSSSDDDYGESFEEGKMKPWEEESGFYAVVSKLLKYVSPSYVWTLRKAQVNTSLLRKEQIFNHFQSAPFTTKIGLYRSLQDLPWIKETSVNCFFPRCFVLTEDDERQAFIEDFRLTACMGIVRLVKALPAPSEEMEKEEDLDCFFMQNCGKFRWSSARFPSITPVMAKSRQAPEDVVKFAILHVKHCLNVRNHCDVDNSKPSIAISPEQWRNFLSWTYRILRGQFEMCNAGAYRHLCQQVHEQFAETHDQEGIDGTRNVWIIKPAAKSRGRGIECYDQLEPILSLVETSLPVCANRLIAQKYIERPLLVHNTKFDIRQWFLVTDWNPLTIWWYRQCYLRFCSHEFTLDVLDESVHLSNNSIQHKYKVNRRTSEIPAFNMWYMDQFLEYLRKRGQEHLWHEVVMPGMKEAVINAMLCSQNTVETRRNSFELFGADFMISDQDFRPWLIEINSSPCMAPSTEVTAALAPAALEDVVKVTLDKRFDRNANTGDFEMILRQNLITAPLYLGMDLTISGTKVKKPVVKPILVPRKESLLQTTAVTPDKKKKVKPLSSSRDLNNNFPPSKTTIDQAPLPHPEPIKVKRSRAHHKELSPLKRSGLLNLSRVELVSVPSSSAAGIQTTNSKPEQQPPQQTKVKRPRRRTRTIVSEPKRKHMVELNLPKVQLVHRALRPT